MLIRLFLTTLISAPLLGVGEFRARDVNFLTGWRNTSEITLAGKLPEVFDRNKRLEGEMSGKGDGYVNTKRIRNSMKGMWGEVKRRVTRWLSERTVEQLHYCLKLKFVLRMIFNRCALIFKAWTHLKIPWGRVTYVFCIKLLIKCPEVEADGQKWRPW